MKKIYAFSLSAVMLLSAADMTWAQSRKTWDFTKGYSDVTKANLTADVNWVSNRTDSEGNTTGWKDGAKMSGTLMANGEPIAELEGLVFGTAGLSNSNNYLLDPASIRMSRANMVVNLPKLVNGQQVMIMAKSPNSTSARGITANTTNLVKESGPDGDVAPGEAGVQTWVWRVETTSEDSVEVSFKILVGGVDISLIQIDKGDGGSIETTPTIAWVYDSSVEEYDWESDPFYAYTPINEQDTKAFDLATYTSEEKSMADSLETFDLVVYSNGIAAGSTYAEFLLGELNRVPVLNFNADLYAAWGQGSTVVPAPASAFTLTEEAVEHDLFADCMLDGQLLTIFDDGDAVEGRKCLGYTLNEGSDFADDEVLAYVGSDAAIHLHGTKNTYMLLPLASENAVIEDEPIISDNLIQLLSNTISYLRGTKGKVLAAGRPAVSYKYDNNVTTVELKSAINGAKIFYTLDDTDPTTASARYTGPLVITENRTVLKAFVTAPAYNASSIVVDTVLVKSKLAAPTYEVSYEGNIAKVKLAAPEDGEAYYNITGSNDPSKSSKFVDSLGLTILRPTVLTAFSYADGKLVSDIVEFVVDNTALTYYNDTLVHLNFQQNEWNPGVELVARYNYYSDEKADSTIVFDEDGVTPIDTVYTYKPADILTEVEIGTDWKVGSYGQRIMVQKTGTSATVGASYGPATALDAGASTNGFTFLQTQKSNDPASGYLRSVVTFQAPFVAALHFTGQAESSDGKLDGKYREAVEISTSVDGENWTVVDTVATNYMKLMSYQTVEVLGDGAVYVKFASANPAKYSNTQKTMIFDICLLAPTQERPGLGIDEVISGEKVVKTVRMFNLSGQQIRVAEQGINIIQTVYSDGSIETRKIMVK